MAATGKEVISLAQINQLIQSGKLGGIEQASKPLNYETSSKKLTIDIATQSSGGYMSAEDKKKLDGLGDAVDVPNEDFIAFITAE